MIRLRLGVSVIHLNVPPRHVFFWPLFSVYAQKESRSLFKGLNLMYFVQNCAQIIELESVWSHDTNMFLSKNSICLNQSVVSQRPRPIARTMTPAYKKVQLVAICLLPTEVELKIWKSAVLSQVWILFSVKLQNLLEISWFAQTHTNYIPHSNNFLK